MNTFLGWFTATGCLGLWYPGITHCTISTPPPTEGCDWKMHILCRSDFFNSTITKMHCGSQTRLVTGKTGTQRTDFTFHSIRWIMNARILLNFNYYFEIVGPLVEQMDSNSEIISLGMGFLRYSARTRYNSTASYGQCELDWTTFTHSEFWECLQKWRHCILFICVIHYFPH